MKRGTPSCSTPRPLAPPRFYPPPSFPDWLHHLQRSSIYQHVGSFGAVRGGRDCALTLSFPNPSLKDMPELGRCPQPLPQPPTPGAQPASSPDVGKIPRLGLLYEIRLKHIHVHTYLYVHIYACIYLKYIYTYVYTHAHICRKRMSEDAAPRASTGGIPAAPDQPGPAPAALAQGGGPGAPGGGTEPRGLGLDHRGGSSIIPAQRRGRGSPVSHTGCHTQSGIYSPGRD